MTTQEMIKIAEENVERLEKKDFFIYFFVLDTKGNPSSALEYIYKTALTLHKDGYNVKILHNEKDFIGVGDWLGEEYANLPHANTEKENVEITASDFLFIPEIFANVMMQTKKLPCKRVILVQNAYNITEFMPVSQSLTNLGITDAVVTTKAQGDKLQSYFPDVRTHIVHPSISPIFKRSSEPQKLAINIVAKDQTDVNRIVKTFYWQNPIYRFVSFRDLRGLTQESFAEALRDAAITIWADDKTPFGYTLLEAIRSGSVVLAKVPDEPTEWMLDSDGNLTEKILWFERFEEVASMIAPAVRSWTRYEIPDEVYEDAKSFDTLYSEDVQKAEIEHVYIKTIVDRRLNEFKEVLAELKNKEKEGE
jgi:hypothetical protein